MVLEKENAPIKGAVVVKKQNELEKEGDKKCLKVN